MSEDRIELFITGALLISLIFLTLTYKLSLGAIFVGMFLFNVWVYFGIRGRLTQNSKPNNTFSAILTAAISLVILLFIVLFVSTSFQGLLNLTTQPTWQSILRSGFATTGLDEAQPIFASSVFLTVLTFGVVIATVETRFLGRAQDWLAHLTHTDTSKFSVKTFTIWVAISSVFVFYHFNAKGIVDNVALLITFIFSIISLYIISKHRELESATYLHIFNNMFYIMPKISQYQASTGG